MRFPRLAAALWRLLGPPRRRADVLIGPTNDPYMCRWHLFRCKWLFNVYLHHIRHSDDDRAPHDHPWWSVSLMLTGHLIEVYRAKGFETNRLIDEGTIVFRRAKFTHRLVKPNNDRQTWTLFITGPKVRAWGFHCPEGRWVHWRDFCDDQDSGKIGRGCGEVE